MLFRVFVGCACDGKRLCGSSWKTRSVFQGAVGEVCASTATAASTRRIRLRRSGSRMALLHQPRVQLAKSLWTNDLRCTCVTFQPEFWEQNCRTLASLGVRAHRGDHALWHQHRASSTQGKASKVTHMNFRGAVFLGRALRPPCRSRRQPPTP